MTALDTTNLRLTFTAPANGRVMVRQNATISRGSASPWFPSILLGVLEGATVRGRVAPNGYPMGLVGSANMFLGVESFVTISGLTQGQSYTWDAAYGVEMVAAGSMLAYGGPNDATANNAFGGYVFEIYDTA